MIIDDTDQVEEHASVKQLKHNSELGGSVTLEECFEVIEFSFFCKENFCMYNYENAKM